MRYSGLKTLIIVVLLTGLAAGFRAFAADEIRSAEITDPFQHNHWQGVLETARQPDGSIDFLRLRANANELNQYLDQLNYASPENLPEVFPTQDDRLAYWVNAHNALALRLALDRFPADSLNDADGYDTSAIYRMGGVPMSLVSLEAKIAEFLPQMPNLLYALSDYTMDTPPVAVNAYDGAQLRAELSDNALRVKRDNPLFHGQKDASGCVQLQLSPALRAFQQVLLRDNAAWSSAEDADLLPEDMRYSDDPSASLPNWADRLRPFAPARLAGDLGMRCHHGAQFRPANRRLRIFQNDARAPIQPGGF